MPAEQIESGASTPTVPLASAIPLRSRKRIHVMYIVDRLYLQGGGEEALLRVVQNLSQDCFRVSMVTFEANPTAARIVRDARAELTILPIARVYGWKGLRAAAQLRQMIRSGGVDIVHTFFETSNTWGGLVATLSRVPVLISSRRDMGILRLRKHRIAYKLINRFCDGFVTVSDSVRDFCVKTEGLAPERVFTTHNGVDLARIDAANGLVDLKAKLGIADNVPVVTTVANIRRVKGLDTLLRAANIVRREFPKVRFVIAGAPLEKDHYDELLMLARQFDLPETVTFLGNFEQVFALLKLSDVFCLVSRSEGFSNALLEAMAAGLPCVATRAGGNVEAIEDGRNGFLVPPDDVEAAAQRIKQLLRNPDEALRMGLAARQTVSEKFTSEKMAHQLEDLYRTFLADREISAN